MDIPETDNQRAEGKENPKAERKVVFVFPVLKGQRHEMFFLFFYNRVTGSNFLKLLILLRILLIRLFSLIVFT
jgi:hypothetical protein